MENLQTTEPLQKTSPKDFFLHLLAMATLYASAINLGTLIFQYINLAFPDPLNSSDYYMAQAIHSTIRFAIASLIILFPAYLIVSWYLNKSYAVMPFKRNLRIRRWLIYFTLFVAALIMLCDLVSLVYNLLGGEFTIRFILKVLTVGFIAGSVFYYYFEDVRKYRTE